MEYYFRLQFKMLNRHLEAFGVKPVLGYVLSLVVFVGLSQMLFIKTDLAVYIYLFLAMTVLGMLSEEKRNEFLKNCFSTSDYQKIRWIENWIVVMPFALFLAVQMEWLFTLFVFLLAILFTFFNTNHRLNYAIPTPFYKYPFEFLVGFRKAVAAYGFIIFILVMAISVGNFGLGLFTLVITVLIGASFYSNLEDSYYIWIFNRQPKSFLWQKIRIAIGYVTLLCLPVTIALGIAFFDKTWIVLGIQALGYLFLTTVIFAKYSAYPNQIALPEGLMIALCLWFPPLIVFVLPFFYSKSIKKLKTILQ